MTALDTLVHDQFARPDSKPGLAIVSAADAAGTARAIAPTAAAAVPRARAIRADLRIDLSFGGGGSPMAEECGYRKVS